MIFKPSVSSSIPSSPRMKYSMPPTLKIRATSFPYFRIGTEPQTFIHATLLLLQGRDEATRAELNAIILNVLAASAPTVGSITVRDVEIDRATYAKRLSA
jgi:5-carboxymethyl-2-hydroxymuconate isomerase